MPMPVGRPAERGSPEVSECRRMPDRRRPAASATSPWAPSWAMVTACRVVRQRTGERTSRAAAAAVATSIVSSSCGTVAVTRVQNRPRSSTVGSLRSACGSAGQSTARAWPIPGGARGGRPISGSRSTVGEGSASIAGVDLLVSLPAFLLAVLLISASPGPAMALIFRRAALRGLRGAVPTVLGLEAGLYVWALFAGAGFAALVAASEVAYLVLRVVGAAVLLWLGLRAWRTAWRERRSPSAAGDAVPAEPPGRCRACAEGLVVQLANPKAAGFMIAFSPQFVPATGPSLRPRPPWRSSR